MPYALFMLTLLNQQIPPGVLHVVHFTVADPCLESASAMQKPILSPMTYHADHQALPPGDGLREELPLAKALAEEGASMTDHKDAQFLVRFSLHPVIHIPEML